MTIDLVREVYGYHHWANRRLFDVAAALGEDAAARDLGRHFSLPTLPGIFAHVYGADRWWLARWQGAPAAPAPAGGTEMTFGEAPTPLAELRPRWDALEAEQRRFIGGLGADDLGRVVEGQARLGTFRIPLGMLLLHVANHATHHRSEIATMLTLLSGSPPDTGIVSYYRSKTV
jgi:uncharacterized damage-inducible protein DinB